MQNRVTGKIDSDMLVQELTTQLVGKPTVMTLTGAVRSAKLLPISTVQLTVNRIQRR